MEVTSKVASIDTEGVSQRKGWLHIREICATGGGSYAKRIVVRQCKKPTRKWHIWFFRHTSQRSKNQRAIFCQRTG
jgi:hypothetical protein